MGRIHLGYYVYCPDNENYIGGDSDVLEIDVFQMEDYPYSSLELIQTCFESGSQKYRIIISVPHKIMCNDIFGDNETDDEGDNDDDAVSKDSDDSDHDAGYEEIEQEGEGPQGDEAAHQNDDDGVNGDGVNGDSMIVENNRSKSEINLHFLINMLKTVCQKALLQTYYEEIEDVSIDKITYDFHYKERKLGEINFF